MKLDKEIKPIPKYILNLIKKQDKKDYPQANGFRRFYSYLTKYNGELCLITVAVRNKYSKWYCKQVAIHGINSDNCYVKDLEYSYIMGYTVGWYEEGLSNTRKWYETGKWDEAYDKYYKPFSLIVNREYALKQKEFKYSMADKYNNYDLFKYLRLYRQYPQAEYLMKLNLQCLATSKTILRLIGKDKKFRTWIIKNCDELRSNYYYTESIITAYKKNKPLKQVQEYNRFFKSFVKNINYKPIKAVFNDIEEFYNYITVQKIDEYSYADYLRACTELRIDMTIDKNKKPHDFKRWHDIRIDELHTKQAEIDAEKRKELYEKFAIVSEKYLSLQRDKENYVAIIAKSPAELINEGNVLHHCVGRMGYDQKFAREETLIFFIRTKEEPEIPLVTLEYSLSNHKVLQCYADNDSRPSEIILDFVNKIWLPYANRKVRKLAI